MKKLLAIILAIVAVAPAFAAAGISLSVDSLSAGRDGSRFFVTMTVNPRKMHLGVNERIEILPTVTSADKKNTVVLDPVIVAGTNMYYSTMRNGTPGQVSALHRAGRGNAVKYAVSVPFEPWMANSEVSLDTRVSGCCNVPGQEEDIPVALVDLRPRKFAPKFNYIAPLDTAEKRFNLSGRANVRFIVNRTNIDWSYANNYVELDSILRTVNAVKGNPDATVESITLTGFASPEGPYDNNVRLAKGRTEVVKEYVRNNASFPASIYHTSSVPEDWQGLREWLLTSTINNRDAMIAFIDDPKVPVRTKNEEFMRRFPKEYPFILANVYPPLRHTDYRITYKVRKYLNVDEIREVFKTRPGNLSENEFFLLANSYEPGSAQYDHVFDVCVSKYPKNVTANLNAANSAMNRQEYDLAEQYLANAGDSAEAIYGRGILEALRGNYSAAVELFRKAADAGIGDANDAIDQCQAAMKAVDGVKYINTERLSTGK